MEMTINPDVLKVRRKTDSLLDWLGDWGGLRDGLHFLADIIVSPLSAYMMKSKIVSLLVKFIPSASTPKKDFTKKKDFIFR